MLTQYQPLILNEYIGNGQPWDLDRTYGGVHILSPYQAKTRSSWYEGTANAIYQNMNFMKEDVRVLLDNSQIMKKDILFLKTGFDEMQEEVEDRKYWRLLAEEYKNLSHKLDEAVNMRKRKRMVYFRR